MEIKELLRQVQSGEMSLEAAESRLKDLPYEDLGFAKLDLHRKLRSGFPETVFCQGKPDEYLVEIFKRLYERNGEVLGTRADERQYELVKAPVAEEAAQTAEFFGSYVDRIYDVGVAGIHRLLAQRERIQKANCVVAVAGMEGALGTVIAGLVENPVIAVPTSVGYGANFKGLSALLTMINSCANGISVVNIDNGYGAGYLSTQINRLAVK